jgi:putative inorganic carbon (HCO3(-)) transporter
LSEVLAVAGILIAAAAAASSILLPPGRPRSAAMLLALALFPVLILGDQWHSAQIEDLRHEPAGMIVLAMAATAVAIGLLATAFRRWPIVLPLAIVFALPFRIPLHAAGDTANLLVPLYVVIAAAVLATVVRDWAAPPTPARLPTAARRLPQVLAAIVVLYALQALYSPDFSKSLQNLCFFFVPFSLVYALLRDVDWNARLLASVLWIVALEAIAFVVVGSVEYATRSLFWNDQVIRANDFHTYFRVNSVFWDPNIYGRYLALAIVIAASALLWAKERRTLALLTALIAILWLGLLPTFSQSSSAALLGGLAVLAALRWRWRWVLVAVGVAVVLGALTINPGRLNGETGGRANLVSGGAELFAQRPLWGYGAGSFPSAYREHVATKKAPVSVSHTEPVTVAAEQGAIGLVAYAALLIAALWTMGAGMFSPRRAVAMPIGQLVGRAAVLAAFVALLVHTMAYAGFFEDPITWTLLAAGASLAAPPRVRAST